MPEVPARGIYEALDPPPRHRAFSVFVAGERRLRLEIVADDASDEVIVFLWHFLIEHDAHLRLVD